MVRSESKADFSHLKYSRKELQHLPLRITNTTCPRGVLTRDQPRETEPPRWHEQTQSISHNSRASFLSLQGQIQSLQSSNSAFSSISPLSQHHSTSSLSTYRAVFVSRSSGCKEYKRVGSAALSISEARPGRQRMNHARIARKLLQ